MYKHILSTCLVDNSFPFRFFFQGRCRLYFTKQRSREITISLIAKGFRCTTIIIHVLWRTWCFLFLESLTLVNRRWHIYDSLNWENYSRKYLQVNDFLTYLYNKIKISTMCSSVIDLFFIYLFILENLSRDLQ